MTSSQEALDTLTALFPQHSTTTLKQYLDASNQDVDRAFRAIERGEQSIVTSKSKRRKVESGLKDWLKGDKKAQQAEVLVLTDSDEETPSTSRDVKPSLQPSEIDLKPPIKSAFSLLRPPRSFSSNPNPTSTTIKVNSTATHVNLPPLRLTTAAMIARETRGLITLVENALPEELASRLYVRMVEASRGEGKGDKGPCEFDRFRSAGMTELTLQALGKRNKWFLVDREVESPHTSAFYTEPDSSKSNDGWTSDSYDLVSHSIFFLSSYLTSTDLDAELIGSNSLVQWRIPRISLFPP